MAKTDLDIIYDDEKKSKYPEGHIGLSARGLSNREIDVLQYNGFKLDGKNYIAIECDRNNDIIKAINAGTLDEFLSPAHKKFYKVKEIINALSEIEKKVKKNELGPFDFIELKRFIENQEIWERRKHSKASEDNN